jgi:outer membrane lipoprotein SlyB
MRRAFLILGSAFLLAGCAHERGSTGDVYYSSDSGMVTSTTTTTTNANSHIEQSRQPEYPLGTQPRFDNY